MKKAEVTKLENTKNLLEHMEVAKGIVVIVCVDGECKAYNSTH
jgi:hypothetical protein